MSDIETPAAPVANGTPAAGAVTAALAAAPVNPLFAAPQATAASGNVPVVAADGTPWFTGLSADAVDDRTPSDVAWAKIKAYPTLNAQVAAHRELERQFHSGDKIVVPKDLTDAKAMDAVWDRLGRPADAKGYDLKVPEGADPAFAAKFAEAAHKAGMPASMASAAVDWWNGEQAAAAKAVTDRNAAEVGAMRSAWGKDFDGNVATLDRAAERFGLTSDMLAAMRDTIGPKAVADHLLKVGKAMGEHGLEGGGAKAIGGFTPETAVARKGAIMADKAQMAKITAKDPAALAEWNAIAAAMTAGEEAARNAD